MGNTLPLEYLEIKFKVFLLFRYPHDCIVEL
jgi:hypothetical protein